MSKKPVWIAGIARGHNSGVCLLKDGEIVFSIEEERLSRVKYDGGPFASILKIKEYTDKLDFMVFAHTTPLDTAGVIEYTGDVVYVGFARKLGLIDNKGYPQGHPQVIDLSNIHHKLHAACAFYRSGWDSAAALVVDGAGTFFPTIVNGTEITTWETESIYDCEYPANFKTLYKHQGTWVNIYPHVMKEMSADWIGEPGETYEAVFSDRAGIVKVYEAVSKYCGFEEIEAGKTMGLFPYGQPNNKIPALFNETGDLSLSDRNVIIPTYPSGAGVNTLVSKYLDESIAYGQDLSQLQNRRDLAYACQVETQDQVVKLIRDTVKRTGKNRVVISGGYGLNCVANYHYLDALKNEGIEIYVEPISNDAGTAMGAALYFWHGQYQDMTIRNYETLYLGPKHNYSINDILQKSANEGVDIIDASYKDIVNLLTNKNIVTIFQGQSENGPRALGNRSVLFDPRFEDGKDFVNTVKRREYFRPFAGSILEEHVHEWFDLRGMKNSPHMMYAVNCQPGVADKIPSIIHVDGTCRIQTVTPIQNLHYYNLIKEFYNQTGVPILFNTSFNLGGEPLVETLEDAIRTLKNSDIEYLFLPEFNKLITVKNV